jgi:hypothetical protein
MLEKISSRNVLLEFGAVHEMVVFAVDLSGTRFAGGAGNSVDRVGCLTEGAADGRFSCPRRSGNNEEDAEAFHKRSLKIKVRA